MTIFNGEASPREWAITHAPAANAQATISRAAESGKRHICTGICIKVVGNTTAANATGTLAHLRDGASGAGTILQSFIMLSTAAGATDTVTLTGLNIIGSVNVAMTLELAAAPGAAIQASVALSGHTIDALYA